MQDLNDKITGNSLTAAEWNEVPSEIQNVIEGLGIALSGGDLNQLGKAIAGYAANGSFYTDSGAADAYVLSVIGSKQALPEYTDGMEIAWLADNANTGASTVNVAGLGVKDIKTLGGNIPAAGDVSVTAINYARYDLANGWFVLQDSPDSLITQITITPPTDADVTLTNAQATRDRLVLVDGSWTTGHSIIFPNESRRCYVDNIAGSFDALAKTAAGTGVTVRAGTALLLVCDAVNVLDPQSGSIAASITGWTLIESWTPTAVNSKDFTWDESLYSEIKIVLEGCAPATDDSDFACYLGHTNGTVFYTGASDYANTYRTIDGITLQEYTASDDRIRISSDGIIGATGDGVGSASGEGISSTIALRGMNSIVSKAYFTVNSAWEDLLNNGLVGNITGFVIDGTADTTALDSIRLIWEAGNFQTVGKVTVYGLKEA